MSVSFKDCSVMILDAGFMYSSEDISKSLYRAFERICGTENVYEFNTQSGLDFCRKILGTYNLFHNKDVPTHHDVLQLLCDPILRYTIQTQVDYIIAIHGMNINVEVIDCLRIALPNTRTICWCLDDPMQVDISTDYASHYDYVFTNEKNCVGRHGRNRAFHLQTAFDDGMFTVDKKELPDQMKSDILISGSIYKNRYDFIEELYEYIKDYNIKIIGKIVDPSVEFTKPGLLKAYNNEIIPIYEMARYMASAKICLDIPRPNDVSEYGRTNKANVSASYLNPRIYETAGAGSLILTSEERDQIKESFDKDEYTTYENVEDCANKIIYYLENKDERLEIAEKGRKTAWKKHRYIDRAGEMLEVLPEKAPNARLVGLSLSAERQNEIALDKHKELWQKNFNENVEFIDVGSLQEYEDSGQGRTALIVSNAPSLEKNLDALYLFNKSGKLKNVDIFSVNSAYRLLRSKDIIPKFHIQIHPTDDQAKHFEGVEQDKTIFLASALLSNNVIHAWEGEKRLFVPRGTLLMGMEIPEPYKKKVALIESALVVGFSATAMAIHLVYRKIAWLGFDFSYVNNQKYAYEDCIYDEEIRNGFIVRKDVNGSPVITNHIMLEACNYMAGLAIGQKNIDFYNLSNAGLLYGEEIKTTYLDEFIELVQMGEN